MPKDNPFHEVSSTSQNTVSRNLFPKSLTSSLQQQTRSCGQSPCEVQQHPARSASASVVTTFIPHLTSLSLSSETPPPRLERGTNGIDDDKGRKWLFGCISLIPSPENKIRWWNPGSMSVLCFGGMIPNLSRQDMSVGLRNIFRKGWAKQDPGKAKQDSFAGSESNYTQPRTDLGKRNSTGVFAKPETWFLKPLFLRCHPVTVAKRRSLTFYSVAFPPSLPNLGRHILSMRQFEVLNGQTKRAEKWSISWTWIFLFISLQFINQHPVYES